MRFLGLLSVVAVVGCGAGTTQQPSRQAKTVSTPPTEWDPPAWTPSPEERTRTGEVTAAAVSGGYDQARALTFQFLRGVRDGDAATLERLLGNRLARVLPRLGGRRRPRAHIVERAVRAVRHTSIAPDTELGALIHLEQVQVDPVARAAGDRALPAGLQGTDLRVTFPLRPRGRHLFRFLSGWTSQGGVVVRPGVEPRIVAL